jgi:hypothetical protein
MQKYKITYEIYFDENREEFSQFKTFEVNAESEQEAKSLSADLVDDETDNEFYITSIEKIIT